MNIYYARKAGITVHFEYDDALRTIQTGAFKEVRYNYKGIIRVLRLRQDGTIIDSSY